MDKLNIALRLIQLLNERKSINSKYVAEEFNVSLRTAQRYLAELSMLPCVMNLNNNHTFAINPEYKLHDIISNGGKSESNQGQVASTGIITRLNTGTCLLCASTNKHVLNSHVISNSNNLTMINRLASIIEKKLKLKKCSYTSIRPFFKQ